MALDATDLELIARTLLRPFADEIRGEMRAMRVEMVAGFDGLNTRVGRLETSVDGLATRVDRLETSVGRLNSRVDQLILNTGEHWRDHERRLLRLERIRNGNGSGSDDDEGESGDE